MQKNISTIKQTSEPEQKEKPKPNPRDIVLKFPNETRAVIVQLAQLISSGEFDEKIDGGQLLSLFRTIGLNVRMQTKINVEQDGKFVSLTDKLKSKKNDEE